jgi:hypothetical protein
MIKPGYKTSEFWLTVVSFIFSGLYLVGLLDDHSQKEDLIAETSRGVEAFILIVGQLAVLFRYIKGRTEIKKIWWGSKDTEPEPTPVKTIISSTKKKKPVAKKNNRKPPTKK